MSVAIAAAIEVVARMPRTNKGIIRHHFSLTPRPFSLWLALTSPSMMIIRRRKLKRRKNWQKKKRRRRKRRYKVFVMIVRFFTCPKTFSLLCVTLFASFMGFLLLQHKLHTECSIFSAKVMSA